MGDIIAVYTIPGEIDGVAVTKIVYVLNSALDSDCGEIAKYSDGSDGTGWIETNGGGGGDITEKFEISSAQLLTLPTLIPLMAAPGAGKVIQVLDIVYRYNFVSIPYTGAPNISIQNNTGGSPLGGYYNGLLGGSSTVLSAAGTGLLKENDGLSLTSLSPLGGGGNGTLDIYITYRIIDL